MRYEQLSHPAINALDRDRTILLLPLGAVEQHGHHMPVGTDTMIAHALCLAAARERTDIVVLPPPWYGHSPHHMAFPGTITLSPETLLALVRDIVGSAVAHGFRRVLLVNGHGGNSGAVDMLAASLGHTHYGQARIAGLTYFHLAASEIDAHRESEKGGTGHAGEFETSVGLHLFPDLVEVARADTVYPDPGSPHLTTDLTGSSPIRTYLDFSDLSASGVLGDARLANAERGERFFAACAAALARFLEDFAGWPLQR